MSLQTNGTWKAAVWAATVWKSGVWREGAIGLTTTGGGSSLSYDEWLSRHPWVRDLECRPNWYIYPEERQKVKAQLVKVAKQKRSVERKLSFAKSADDLSKLVVLLNRLQEEMNKWNAFYATAMEAFKAQEEEDEEFLELMTEVLMT